MEKVINVFYDTQGYPFKDKELTTRFPIVGSAFQGADNTTEIRFYVDELSANRQWAVFGKLPNGKKGFKVLTESVLDEDEDRYYPFMLSQFFTQYKGDLYLSLGGYYGNIVELNEEQEYELQQVSGEMTGAIKLNIAYSVQMEGSDYDELPQWLQALASKLDTNKGIVVIPNTSASVSGYQEDQLFYSKADQMLYKLVSGALVPQGIGIIKTNSVANGTIIDKNKVALDMCYVIFNSTGVIYRKTGVEGGLAHFVSELEFVDGNTSGNDTFGRSQFDVNLSSGAISNSELYSKDLYNKDQIDTQFYNKSQANDKYAKLGENNTFTGSNVFNTSPQTNEQISDSSADTKLTTKKYVKDLMDEHLGDYDTLKGRVDTIDDEIPSQASSSNKLADRDWVNSTINSLASFYITKNAQGDPFATYSELASATTFYSGGQVRVPTRNDYCLVVSDENHDNASCRYIYQGNQWEFQFVVNETPFTSDQLKAINSGITDILVAQITNNQNAITTINSKLPKIKDFVIPTTSWKLNELDNYDTFTNTSDYIGYYVIYNSQYEKVTNDNKDDLSIIAGTTIAYTGNFFAELDAGVDFVIDDNAMKNYCGTNANDQNLIGALGIIASSDSTTQKFKFECYRSDTAPTEVINFTIAQFGGN